MAANLLENDSSFVKMVILSDNREKVPLTQSEADEIEKYILDQICSTNGRRPHFRGEYVFCEDDGTIIINTHVDSVNWLKDVIKSYKTMALKITDIKNSPQYTAKVKTYVAGEDKQVVDNLLVLLEAHNYGLHTDGWRIVSEDIHYDYYQLNKVIGYHITLLIDDPGRRMLEENGFKLFVGFKTMTFELLGRVKRCETTGRICEDVIRSQED